LARNLLQFTNPRRFRERLVDIEVPPPLGCASMRRWRRGAR
jgi:hypothetical protein